MNEQISRNFEPCFVDGAFSMRTLEHLFTDQKEYSQKIGTTNPPVEPIYQWRVAALAFQKALDFIESGGRLPIEVFRRRIFNSKTQEVEERALIINSQKIADVIWLRNIYQTLGLMSIDRKKISDIPAALDDYTLTDSKYE